MSIPQDYKQQTCRAARPVDWPQLVEQAAKAVSQRLLVRRELRPREVADTVIATLPAGLAAWLHERLSGLGWLDDAARLPFDLLDSPACPPDFRGGRRELVRVAVFGVAGEGVRFDAKRREAIYQQRCAEIMREMRDLESLSYAAARALGHPEVHGDPILFNMLRAFIAEREAELQARAHLPRAGEEEEEGPAEAAPQKPAPIQVPLHERVQAALSKLRLELESYLTTYNTAGAANVVSRIKDLRRRYPAHVEEQVVDRCEEQAERLAERRDQFREQLIELAHQASEAGAQGDQKTASWVVRRLSAIHTVLPAVLPRERYEELREEILLSCEKEERHEVLRELVARERAVGAEVKKLGAIIHRYRRLIEKGTSDAAVMQQAEEEYRHAVEQARRHGDEWLADLMIELDCLLDDLHGPRERAAAQVDKFVNNVRAALNHTRQEIEIIQKERAAPAKDH